MTFLNQLQVCTAISLSIDIIHYFYCLFSITKMTIFSMTNIRINIY